MIEVAGLTHYYGSHPAVLDVSFTIQDHEIVGFLGLNGAGKSTTLKVLAGLLLPSAGTVKVQGVDAVDSPDSARERIGYLPEDPPLYPEMRVREFLIWAGQLKGRAASQVKERLPMVLKICQLEEVANRPIDELSHGYRKRVGIAQAIVHNPELVILDEPISGLDPVQIAEMRKVIRSLKEHCTVLISSHNLPEISQTCDRILMLDGGRLQAEGTEAELRAKLAGTANTRLSLRGDPHDIMAVADSQEGVGHARVEDGDNGLCTLYIKAEGQAREWLVAALVGAGVGIHAVEDADAELEQIFMDVMKEKTA